ncbi:MAG: PEP/pyruvate-binding domain-containing protein [Candidatus Eiseniibacteriota bacterium]|jgi:pyruvate,water dikinase
MSDYIVDLHDLGRDSVSVAGGKGSLLGELLSRGYPVPRGCCITTGAYDDFLEISGIDQQVREARALTDESELLEAGEGIMQAIQEAAIPADLAVGLSTVYRALGQRPRVAVRPSPAYQSMLRSPISGKTDHFLNVIGEKDLFQAVRDIWSGIWDPLVVSYCRRRSIAHAELKPAVIIQAMVRPISSGSIFTADPMSGDRDMLLISAGWGMKQESITGRVAPDTYHVDRETLTLRYKRINTKELMVSASGLVPVPKNRRNAVVLKDAAIRDLCQMATGIEDIFGEPAEVEWCVLQGGRFMVLEALPVALGDDVLTEEPSAGTIGTDAGPAREPANEAAAGVAATTTDAATPQSDAAPASQAPAEPDAPPEHEMPAEPDAPPEHETPAELDAPPEHETPPEPDASSESETPPQPDASSENETPPEPDSSSESETPPAPAEPPAHEDDPARA